MALTENRFLEHWQDLVKQFPDNPFVIVGFSGGPDSWSLVHLLNQSGVRVAAAHLNHKMRLEADQEAKLLEQECRKRGIQFIGGSADVPLIAKSFKIGIEEAGRKARYDFLERVKRGTGAQLIATAHNRNDQVETFFLHVLRGSGLTGLGGIPAVRGDLIRPMLPFSRQEIESYCEEHQLPVLHDPGNDNLHFDRVRLRKEVLPSIREIQPSFDQVLTRSMQIWQEDDAYLNALAVHEAAHCQAQLNGALSFISSPFETALNPEAFGKLPLALRRRIIRLICGVWDAKVDYLNTELATNLFEGSTSQSVTTEESRATICFDRFGLRFSQNFDPSSDKLTLNLNGITTNKEQTWQITSRPSTSRLNQARNALSITLPTSATNQPLQIQFEKEGQKMQPSGFDKHRKLSDLIGEAHLTPLAKKMLPIVVDESGPIWLPGICFDHRCNVGSSEPAVELIFEPFVQA